MKKKKLISTRNKSNSELAKLVTEMKKENRITKAKLSIGDEKNLKKSKSIKYDIAQILTMIRENEIINSIKK